MNILQWIVFPVIRANILVKFELVTNGIIHSALPFFWSIQNTFNFPSVGFSANSFHQLPIFPHSAWQNLEYFPLTLFLHAINLKYSLYSIG